MKDQNGKVVRKTLTKKQVLELRAGTLVRVAWVDHPDTVHLLLERAPRQAGEVDLNTFKTPSVHYDEDSTKEFRFVTSDQIVEALAQVDFEVSPDRCQMFVYANGGKQVISLN